MNTREIAHEHGFHSLKQVLHDAEKNLILEAIEFTKGNQTAAARLIGVSRTKLIYRLKEYSHE
jgi:DNA-binding NtrC family response regulator